MMRRVFSILTSEVNSMHHAAYVLGVFTLLSSLLAFLRDRLLAHTFGAGPELDLYYAAFRIPDTIFILVASLVSAYILIPELIRRTDSSAMRRYIETVTSGFFLVIAVVAGGVFVFAPTLLSLLFPALAEGPQFTVLVDMTRILLLQPILLGFSNILAAVVQVKSRYVIYALSPVLYNFGIMIGVVAFYPTLGLAGLAWGVVLGAIMHVGIQIPTVWNARIFPIVPLIHDVAALVRTAHISLPRTLALSMNQFVLLAFAGIATTMIAGSLTVFTFAFNLQSVPLAIVGASYSVAAFPTLARMFSNGSKSEFVVQVQMAARHIIFWSLPIIGLSIILRAHLVRTVLGTGAFDWTDTRLTAAAFALLIVSLTAHALTLLLVRGYYAAGRSYVPLVVQTGFAFIAVGFAVLFTNALRDGSPLWFFESFLRVEDVPGTIVLALPLAYSIAALLSAVLLVFLFERHFGEFISGILRPLGEGVVAAGIGGAVAYGVLFFLGGISAATTFVQVLSHGFLAGIAGLAAVIATFAILGSRELREAYSALHRRVWKVSPVSSAEEEV